MIRIHGPMMPEEKEFCEYWLRFHTTLYSKLASGVFDIDSIAALVKYEANTRRRIPIVDRLLGRYFKLYRQKEFNRIKQIMEESDDIGENYRAIFALEGTRARWPSNKTNFVKPESAT